MEEIKGILELLKRFPEQIVVFQREDEDCIYHDRTPTTQAIPLQGDSKWLL